MFGGMSYKLSILRKKTVSSGDVTPNAVEWFDQIFSPLPITTNSQTITGIDTTITLRIDVTSDDGMNLQYSKNSGANTNISNGGTISMSNNDTLLFNVNSGPAGGTIVFDVVNQSDSNTILDTITLNREMV